MPNVVEQISYSECSLRHEFELGEFRLLDTNLDNNTIKVKPIRRPMDGLRGTDDAYWTSPTGFYWRHDKL